MVCKGSIRIISPTNGQEFNTGDIINITVEIDNTGDLVYFGGGNSSSVTAELLKEGSRYGFVGKYIEHGSAFQKIQQHSLSLEIPPDITGPFIIGSEFHECCSSDCSVIDSSRDEISINVVGVPSLADIRVDSIELGKILVESDELVPVIVNVKNYGGVYGTKNITLTMDGGYWSMETVNLYPDQSSIVSFMVSSSAGGDHNVCAGGKCASFSVAGAPSILGCIPSDFVGSVATIGCSDSSYLERYCTETGKQWELIISGNNPIRADRYGMEPPDPRSYEEIIAGWQQGSELQRIRCFIDGYVYWVEYPAQLKEINGEIPSKCNMSMPIATSDRADPGAIVKVSATLYDAVGVDITSYGDPMYLEFVDESNPPGTPVWMSPADIWVRYRWVRCPSGGESAISLGPRGTGCDFTESVKVYCGAPSYKNHLVIGALALTSIGLGYYLLKDRG